MNTKRYETIPEAQAAVRAGQTVNHVNAAYELRVWTDTKGVEHWSVVCTRNDYSNGLYWADGVRTDFKATDFYTKESK